VVILTAGSYIAAYTTTITSYTAGLVEIFGEILHDTVSYACLNSNVDRYKWHPLLHMCVLAKATPISIIAFSGPVVFKTIMLGTLLWNAFDRPRQAHHPLLHALRKDGILFYIVSVLLYKCITIPMSDRTLLSSHPPSLQPLYLKNHAHLC
jgi:hypothetical protein